MFPPLAIPSSTLSPADQRLLVIYDSGGGALPESAQHIILPEIRGQAPTSQPMGSLVLTPLPGFAQGHQKHNALSFRVWREEGHYVVVVEGEPGSTQPLVIGCQVELAADDTSLKLSRTVSPVPGPKRFGVQISKEGDVHTGIAWKVLLQTKAPCLLPEITLFEQLQRNVTTTEHIGAAGSSPTVLMMK